MCGEVEVLAKLWPLKTPGVLSFIDNSTGISYFILDSTIYQTCMFCVRIENPLFGF